jgi:hypothetical protein
MTDAASMFKQRQRATWSAGHWDRVAELFDGARRRAAEAGVAVDWIEATDGSVRFPQECLLTVARFDAGR